MTQDSSGATKGSGRLPGLDTGVANAARMWNYWIGGKDNISQVVSGFPHSDRTVPIQARHGGYSKTGLLTRACLFRACIGFNVRFAWRGFLTLA